MLRIAQEMWFIEAETRLRRWDDPGFLSPSVDEVDRQFRTIVEAGRPLLLSIAKGKGEIPYRARVFAYKILRELELDADHLDRFLDKRSLWNAEDFRKFSESVSTSGREIQHLYVDLIPYMGDSRLPREQETELLSALGPLEGLQIPGAEETHLLEGADFTEVEGSVEVEARGFSEVSFKELIEVLKMLGWYKDRQGKHEIWKNDAIRWNIPIPKSNKNLSGNVLRNHLQRMGITKDDLQYLLNKRLQKADPKRMEWILKSAPENAAKAVLHGISQ